MDHCIWSSSTMKITGNIKTKGILYLYQDHFEFVAHGCADIIPFDIQKVAVKSRKERVPGLFFATMKNVLVIENARIPTYSYYVLAENEVKVIADKLRSITPTATEHDEQLYESSCEEKPCSHEPEQRMDGQEIGETSVAPYASDEMCTPSSMEVNDEAIHNNDECQKLMEHIESEKFRLAHEVEELNDTAAQIAESIASLASKGLELAEKNTSNDGITAKPIQAIVTDTEPVNIREYPALETRIVETEPSVVDNQETLHGLAAELTATLNQPIIDLICVLDSINHKKTLKTHMDYPTKQVQDIKNQYEYQKCIASLIGILNHNIVSLINTLDEVRELKAKS